MTYRQPFKTGPPGCRIGLAMEYHIGHRTHADNFLRFLGARPDVAVRPVLLPFHNTPGWWSRLPGVRSNWSLRASLGAALALRRSAVDVAFFHTQVTALLSAGWMRRVPSVISLDATPLQYDRLGAHYGHTVSGNGRIETLKKRLNQKAFGAARRLVTWSQWAKDSLVADYGVSSEKVFVIPPGISTETWKIAPQEGGAKRGVHILFVGGDFERKGGPTLREAFCRAAPHLGEATLHLVTPDKAAQEGSNIRVYRDLTPNSEPLRALFAQADIFAFPTQADCLPLAVLEAQAAGLPVIATTVGALPEVVQDGENGLVVPPQDVPALAEALRTLAGDGALRRKMAAAAREQAQARFEAQKVYAQLLHTLCTAGA